MSSLAHQAARLDYWQALALFGTWAVSRCRPPGPESADGLDACGTAHRLAARASRFGHWREAAGRRQWAGLPLAGGGHGDGGWPAPVDEEGQQGAR